MNVSESTFYDQKGYNEVCCKKDLKNETNDETRMDSSYRYNKYHSPKQVSMMLAKKPWELKLQARW